ncbi:MAG: SDR family oxidoreductase [Clostridiales bacterium]|nr:SDR family oxidoreductase [Clostridiales bacterium]
MAIEINLAGRVAAVTGAGQGLGKTFAKALSQAGAEVYLLARDFARLENTAKEISELTGNKTYPLAVDISDEQSVAAACGAIKEASGRLDILVNNAAVGRSDARLEDETLEEWNRITGTILTGTFLMMKHAGRIMINQRSGKIINISSISGVVSMRNPTVGAYDVSKAGVECLTRNAASAWAEYGIRVNAICPGYYLTDINKAYIEEHEEFYQDSLGQIPLKKWGDPDEIGGLVVFLASDAANNMTGSNVVIDGGYLAW